MPDRCTLPTSFQKHSKSSKAFRCSPWQGVAFCFCPCAYAMHTTASASLSPSVKMWRWWSATACKPVRAALLSLLPVNNKTKEEAHRRICVWKVHTDWFQEIKRRKRGSMQTFFPTSGCVSVTLQNVRLHPHKQTNTGVFHCSFPSMLDYWYFFFFTLLSHNINNHFCWDQIHNNWWRHHSSPTDQSSCVGITRAYLKLSWYWQISVCVLSLHDLSFEIPNNLPNPFVIWGNFGSIAINRSRYASGAKYVQLAFLKTFGQMCLSRSRWGSRLL